MRDSPVQAQQRTQIQSVHSPYFDAKPQAAPGRQGQAGSSAFTCAYARPTDAGIAFRNCGLLYSSI